MNAAERREDLPIKTEHAVMMSGGGYHVRNDAPEIEEIYPLAQWIKSEQRFGGKVYRRTIIVIDGWEEVTHANLLRDHRGSGHRARPAGFPAFPHAMVLGSRYGIRTGHAGRGIPHAEGKALMPEIEAINVRVSRPVKRRLDAMQEEMKRSLGRQVTVSEVMEALLAEHDKAMEAESI